MSTSLMPTLPKLVFSSRTTERTAMMNGLTLVSDTALRHRQGWKLLSPVALRTPYAKSLKTPLLWLCQMPNPISHSNRTNFGGSITVAPAAAARISPPRYSTRMEFPALQPLTAQATAKSLLPSFPSPPPTHSSASVRWHW